MPGCYSDNNNILQVAELASFAQLLSPRSPTVRNPVPDSSLCRAAPRCVRFSCCSPLASLQLLLAGPIAAYASTAAPRLPPLPAAAPDCACFSCCLLAACVCFSCCSRLRPLRLLLPDCVRFNCCAPRLRLLGSSPCHARAQCSRTFFTEFEVQ